MYLFEPAFKPPQERLGQHGEPTRIAGSLGAAKAGDLKGSAATARPLLASVSFLFTFLLHCFTSAGSGSSRPCLVSVSVSVCLSPRRRPTAPRVRISPPSLALPRPPRGPAPLDAGRASPPPPLTPSHPVGAFLLPEPGLAGAAAG